VTYVSLFSGMTRPATCASCPRFDPPHVSAWGWCRTFKIAVMPASKPGDKCPDVKTKREKPEQGALL
jgi:hypothetical protein